MQTGVYSAQKKDGTVYYRANITYQTKHISLGSFSSEEDAHSAYLEACNLLGNEAEHFLTSTVRFAICPLTKQYVF